MVKMADLYAGIACNLDSELLSAALPLFAADEVEAIEWSFDTLYQHRHIPDWFTQLLQAYSDANRLIGHGVFFSLFSGKWNKEQQAWLTHLRQKSTIFQFDHITEHFGFMTGTNFHEGAPLGVPFNKDTLAIGQDRLKRIYEACQCPVGLENLAFAYQLEEVHRHGDFLQQLLSPINGFIILDLHNFYCHFHNFHCDVGELLDSYPLEMVREIHISGGSWSKDDRFPEHTIRRDTHDDAVPEMVFELLEIVLPCCPNLKYVMLEQLGTGLTTQESKAQFTNDFRRMKTIIGAAKTTKFHSKNGFLNKERIDVAVAPLESETLHEQQRKLAYILEHAGDAIAAKKQLEQSILAQSDWKVEDWKLPLLQTAIAIAQKWKAS